jgi:hypothetical protein
MYDEPVGGESMRKTTIELTEEQYFYLQEKVLELKKKNESVSMASLIRDLIEKDRQASTKKGKAGK